MQSQSRYDEAASLTLCHICPAIRELEKAKKEVDLKKEHHSVVTNNLTNAKADASRPHADTRDGPREASATSRRRRSADAHT